VIIGRVVSGMEVLERVNAEAGSKVTPIARIMMIITLWS
jgi:hypothetical protein